MTTLASDTDEQGWVGWVPLEANEDALNRYLNALGVKGVRCEEIWSFDDHIPIIEKPHYALILCYSNFVQVKNLMNENYRTLESIVPEGVFFAQQKIKNACGTFALIHALAQNSDRIDFGNGIFDKWLEAARKLQAVDERSDLLAADSQFAAAHAACASGGATSISEADQNPDSHYICYVHFAGRLMEFDSRMQFPRDCGATTPDSLLRDAADECKKLLSAVPDIQFSAIALVGSPN